MNHEFFDQQIKRLENQWPNAYGAERKALLWKIFKNVPGEHLQDAIGELLATQRTYPLVKEFDAALQVARSRMFERQRNSTSSVPQLVSGRTTECLTCGDTGYDLRQDSKGYRHTFRCSCSIGRSMPAETNALYGGEREPLKIPLAPIN